MEKKSKNIKQKKSAKKKVTRKKKVTEQPIEGLYGTAIQTAVAWFKAGYSEQRVGEIITSSYERFSVQNVHYVLHKASQQIAEQYYRDRKSIVALHLKRYQAEIDSLVTYFEDKEYENVNIKWRKRVMIDKLTELLDTLGAKERVLQMHSKDTQVKIFNKLNVKVKEKKVLFDLSNLSFEDKREMLMLMLKAKRTSNEISGVILNQKVAEVTEDAEFTVVENNNIDKIERTNLPVEEKVKAPRKQLIDVTELLRKNLHKVAEKEFKKKGAKEIAPNIIDRDE